MRATAMVSDCCAPVCTVAPGASCAGAAADASMRHGFPSLHASRQA